MDTAALPCPLSFIVCSLVLVPRFVTGFSWRGASRAKCQSWLEPRHLRVTTFQEWIPAPSNQNSFLNFGCGAFRRPRQLVGSV
jgi:hypothetical protein